MDFMQLAKERYSVRKFGSTKLSQETVSSILEAGRVAPTGANKQPYHIVAVSSDKGLDNISKAGNIYNAPLALIVCAKPGDAWERPFDGKNLADIDSTIVTDHMMLQASQLKLGTLWVCYFEPKIIMENFEIPDGFEPLHILAVGHNESVPQSPDRHDKVRKSIEATVTFA